LTYNLKAFQFALAEQVIDGLDRAVMTMKKGEIAIVTIFPEYGYKDTQTQRDLAVVPPHSTLIYEIELISFIKVWLLIPVS
jgi:FK506-binding protein 4/5